MRWYQSITILALLLNCCGIAFGQQTISQRDTIAFAETHRLSRMAQEVKDRWGRLQVARAESLLQETEKVIAEFPDNQMLLWLKASSHMQLRQLDEAEQVFRRLLAQYSPSLATYDVVREKIAAVRWMKGDYRGAWQTFLAESLLRKLARLLLPFLLLAVLARAARRWIGGWALLQVWTALLLALWYGVSVHLTAWLVLGVPFPTETGNTDSYNLLFPLFFWAGVLSFTYWYRQRYVVHFSATRSRVSPWIFAIALILGMSVPAYNVFRLYAIGFSPDISRTLDHITVQAILMLVVGVPVVEAIHVWWLIGTFYKQARAELSALGHVPNIAAAVGWTFLLWSAWFQIVAPAGLHAGLFSILGWLMILSACVLTYESTRRLWLPWLLFTAWQYTSFVPQLLTRIGHL